MKWTVATVLVLTGILLLSGTSEAATLLTTADAYVGAHYGVDTGTHGTETVLTLQVTGGPDKAYVNFDLSSLNHAAAVSSARLKLALNNVDPGYGQTMGIYAIMDPTKEWNTSTLAESAINWTNAPQNDLNGWGPFNPGTAANSTVRTLSDTVAKNNPIDFDVTDLVNWALGQNGGYSTFTKSTNILTFILADTSDAYLGYWSREGAAGNASLTPQLDVTQALVPEPATLGFLAIGGLGLAGAALRRRTR